MGTEKVGGEVRAALGTRPGGSPQLLGDWYSLQERSLQQCVCSSDAHLSAFTRYCDLGFSLQVRFGLIVI